MKCFYHNDMDGKCAAAIVKKFYNNSYLSKALLSFDFIEITYKDEFPFDKIIKDELIVIVDFSLSTIEQWQKLIDIVGKDMIIWIDHHISSIRQFEDLKLYGLRRDGISACELAWEYYFPDRLIPKLVSLLGDYDTWNFLFDNTKYLQLGIKTYNTNPLHDNCDSWLSEPYDSQEIISKGYAIEEYRNNRYSEIIKTWSFPTIFEDYTAIACNYPSANSQLFDSISTDYDLMLPFAYDGNQFTISIYTKKDIDCSLLAKKYGGGGHKKAAGFKIKELPFAKNTHSLIEIT